MNILVCTIGRLDSLGHELLDRGLDFGNPSLGVQSLPNNEMNRWISAGLSILDCFVCLSNSFLDVEPVQVDFIRCGILIVLY